MVEGVSINVSSDVETSGSVFCCCPGDLFKEGLRFLFLTDLAFEEHHGFELFAFIDVAKNFLSCEMTQWLESRFNEKRDLKLISPRPTFTQDVALLHSLHVIKMEISTLLISYYFTVLEQTNKTLKMHQLTKKG